MKKLRQAVALIKEWALDTKHRVSGERMLRAIDSELTRAGLDHEGSVVVPTLDALRRTHYASVPQFAEAATDTNQFNRVEDSEPTFEERRAEE